MASDLPEEVDVVVLGTGIPESILSAAFSRNGYRVLHLDKNKYYSGSWASFSLDDWDKLCQVEKSQAPEDLDDKIKELTHDGEKIVKLRSDNADITNVETAFLVSDPVSEEKFEMSEANSQKRASEHNQFAVSADEQAMGDNASNFAEVSKVTSESEGTLSDQFVEVTTSKPENLAPDTSSATQSQESGADCSSPGKSVEKQTPSQPSPIRATDQIPSQKAWTKSELKKNFRKFNLDLTPKVLYSSGKMVELLISSDVAKYCDFRTVSRILTVLNGKIEKVPCSRADVFGNKKVSMLEKRLLMKFLTFCGNYENQKEEYEGFLGQPFEEFLKSKQLTPNIQHFVQHSIAMATEKTTTEEGLQMTQKFLKSLGRYGNTAFLFPLYGTGELPQAFCRLCAVFGGLYCLQMTAVAIIVDDRNKCTAVITSGGQRIACKWLVMAANYAPNEYVAVNSKRSISRAIVVTDHSILLPEDQELSLLHIPQEDDKERPIDVLELPSSAMVCPKGLCVVHLTRQGRAGAQSDLSSAVDILFQTRSQDESPESGQHKDDSRPNILWSVHIDQEDTSEVTKDDKAPTNVFIMPGPGPEVDVDQPVLEAKRVFETICPEEQFLPKPPHPDDIIYVDNEETPATGKQEEMEGNGEAKDEDDDDAASEGRESEKIEKSGQLCSEWTQSKEQSANQVDSCTPAGETEVDTEQKKGLTEGNVTSSQQSVESELCEKVEKL